MGKITPEKIAASVSVEIDGGEARIEKIIAGEAGLADIRISARKKGEGLAEVLVLSEEQLIELLHQAGHAGVLSQGFIGKLREKIEI